MEISAESRKKFCTNVVQDVLTNIDWILAHPIYQQEEYRSISSMGVMKIALVLTAEQRKPNAPVSIELTELLHEAFVAQNETSEVPRHA